MRWPVLNKVNVPLCYFRRCLSNWCNNTLSSMIGPGGTNAEKQGVCGV